MQANQVPCLTAQALERTQFRAGGGEGLFFSLLRTGVRTIAARAPSRGFAGPASVPGFVFFFGGVLFSCPYLRVSVCARVSLTALIVEGMLKRNQAYQEKTAQAEREGGIEVGGVRECVVGL